MNVVRLFACFLAFAGTAGLWAQDPVLQLERRGAVEGNRWNGRTPLAFRVTVLHPALRKGGNADDFVLDPPGGWRGAMRLVVTDSAGKSVDWPFENMGGSIDQPLRLHRLGTGSASFLLEPKGSGTVFLPGRYLVRAHLASTTGAWRGNVDSPTVAIECVGAAQPQLKVIGLDEGPLMRGWPILFGVTVTVPDGDDGRVSLPTEETEWQKAISVALLDRAGVPVALPIDRIPLAANLRSDPAFRDRRTIWFRVAADASRSLGEGPYRWRATFSRPAPRSPAELRWSGSVSETTAPFPVVAPSVTLSDERVRRRTWAQVEDALVEAKLLRANAEGGYMNDRTLAARQAAVPLHRAERLALQWHEAHPDDPEGALLMAGVMSAQEDKDRAVLYARRAIAADQRRRTSSGSDAVEVDPALNLMARGFETMPDELHTVLTPALRTALKEVRVGKLPAPPSPPVPVTGSTSPAISGATTPAPTLPPAVAPISPPGLTMPILPAVPGRNGEPSPGKVVASAELVEAKILADSAGQWAAAARAGSEYDRTGYSAARATGVPNVPIAGNSPDAWCPAVRNVGVDWLMVTFANPVSAVEVRARQNDAPGAIAKVEAVEPDGTTHLWWEGVDPAKAPTIREIVWFAVRVPKTAYAVAHVKLSLNLASGPGYKQIDAVQLVAAPPQ